MIPMKSLQSIADAYGGLVVMGTLPSSASDRAGVRYGDILLRVNGRPTPTLDAYLAAREGSGDVIEVVILRDGKELVLSLDTHREPSELPPRFADIAERLAQARAFGAPS